MWAYTTFFLTYRNILNLAYREIKIWSFIFQEKRGRDMANQGTTAEASDSTLTSCVLSRHPKTTLKINKLSFFHNQICCLYRI